MSEINGAVPDLVSFQVPGLRHFQIHKPPKSDDCGILLTVIPQSDLAPHMARAKGQRRYYLRNGSQTIAMEHFQVADYFGRRAHPRIRLLATWKVRVGSYSKGAFNLSFDVELDIMNEGRGLLRFPSVTLLREPEGWKGRKFSYLPERPTFGRRWLQFVTGPDLAIHQGDQIPVVHFHYDLDAIPRKASDLVIEYSAIAENSISDDGVFRIPGHEIAESAQRAAQSHLDKEARGELR